jgi:hypothetical protein
MFYRSDGDYFDFEYFARSFSIADGIRFAQSFSEEELKRNEIQVGIFAPKLADAWNVTLPRFPFLSGEPGTESSLEAMTRLYDKNLSILNSYEEPDDTFSMMKTPEIAFLGDSLRSIENKFRDVSDIIKPLQPVVNGLAWFTSGVNKIESTGVFSLADGFYIRKEGSNNNWTVTTGNLFGSAPSASLYIKDSISRGDRLAFTVSALPPPPLKVGFVANTLCPSVQWQNTSVYIGIHYQR